jgi:hypothetical protein
VGDTSRNFFQQCLKEKKETTKREQRKYDKERYQRKKGTISIQRKEKYLKNSNSEISLLKKQELHLSWI